MVNSEVFKSRLSICKKCQYWSGVCLKGHNLSSPVGCPEKRFAPTEGAAYMENKPAAEPIKVEASSCCGNKSEVKELSYVQAMAALAHDLKLWQGAGYALVSDADYEARIFICKACPGNYYRWFQCRACKCIIYAKAKLPVTTCPGGYWPKL
jgi:hypothetical protein